MGPRQKLLQAVQPVACNRSFRKAEPASQPAFTSLVNPLQHCAIDVAAPQQWTAPDCYRPSNSPCKYLSGLY